MKSTHQKKWLSNQEYQRERQRLTRRYIVEALAELEGYPGYQRGYRFPFDILVAGKGLMYFEGFESLKEGLGLETLDLATQPFHTLNLDSLDFSRVPFVSIVYDEAKL